MNIHDARRIYSNPPEFSDEIGRYVGKLGATYRAWHDGKCHIPDEDKDERLYGSEGMNFGNWKVGEIK